MTDLRGGSFSDNTIGIGYGNYIAQPLLRKAWKPDMTKQEAKQLLENCMRVLYYRDARSYNRVNTQTPFRYNLIICSSVHLHLFIFIFISFICSFCFLVYIIILILVILILFFFFFFCRCNSLQLIRMVFIFLIHTNLKRIGLVESSNIPMTSKNFKKKKIRFSNKKVERKKDTFDGKQIATKKFSWKLFPLFSFFFSISFQFHFNLRIEKETIKKKIGSMSMDLIQIHVENLGQWIWFKFMLRIERKSFEEHFCFHSSKLLGIFDLIEAQNPSRGHKVAPHDGMICSTL